MLAAVDKVNPKDVLVAVVAHLMLCIYETSKGVHDGLDAIVILNFLHKKSNDYIGFCAQRTALKSCT